jgi:hypothetical protein
MVGASIMGFEVNEIPMFRLAHQLNMTPITLSDIDIRGLSIEQTKRPFVRPEIVEWTDFGYKEI